MITIDAEAKRIIDAVRTDKRCNLSVDEAFRVCDVCGIPTAPWQIAKSESSAITSAQRIGYPVALKIISPEIVHKSEAAGVMLNISGEDALKAAYHLIIKRALMGDPERQIRGVLVQSMIAPGTEVIVGALRDEQFGPSVMFGLGGVFAEALNDVSFRVAPLSRRDANDMINDLRSSSIMKGFRGRPAPDREAIIDILLKVSEIIVAFREIESLDLNPVIVHEKGAVAVDSRIMIQQ